MCHSLSVRGRQRRFVYHRRLFPPLQPGPPLLHMTFFINYVRGCFVKCIGTWRVYRVLSCYWAENYLVHHQTTVGTGLNVHQRFGIEFRVTKFQNFIVWWIDLFEMVQQVKWMLTNDLVRRRTFVAGTGGTRERHLWGRGNFIFRAVDATCSMYAYWLNFRGDRPLHEIGYPPLFCKRILSLFEGVLETNHQKSIPHLPEDNKYRGCL